jgi:hypothetical protein
MTALNVNPALGLLRLVIALFLQQEPQVKCQPLASGVPKILIVSDLNICSSTDPFPFPENPKLLGPHENSELDPFKVSQFGERSVTEELYNVIDEIEAIL